MKKLVMIGYRPGRKSGMVYRTTIGIKSDVTGDKIYPFNIYENFKQFIQKQMEKK